MPPEVLIFVRFAGLKVRELIPLFGAVLMDKRDWIILYLSISLLVIQIFWIKDIRIAEYQKGRNEVLEVMAEMNYEAAPYAAHPKKGHLK